MMAVVACFDVLGRHPLEIASGVREVVVQHAIAVQYIRSPKKPTNGPSDSELAAFKEVLTQWKDS